MTTLTVKFLGGMRDEMGKRQTTLSFGKGATVADLPMYLEAQGVDLRAKNLIVTLNGRGLLQWAPELPLNPGDVVLVFPVVSGG